MKKARIAIIEDEAIIAKDLEIILERAGYEISGVFYTAEEAISRFESEKPDIVLIDILLKGSVDGIDAGRYLKESLSLPIIYLTANSDDYTLSRAKMTCPDGIILKPYGEKQLKSAIDNALHGNGNSIGNDNEPVLPSGRKNDSMEFIYRNPEIEQFIYLASHDLKEPLRMIASYVQLLQKKYRGKLDSDADDYISYAVDGVNRMKNMIDDLLVYSRLSSGSSFKKLTNMNLEAGRAIEKTKNTFGHSNLIITCDKLPELFVNSEQVYLLFYNLINNAVKFNRSPVPEIKISCSRIGTYWQFAVKDNGPGIENQYAEKVFNIFQKLHNHNEYTGTGMGLAICRKITELHDGRIWFESKPEEGTTFYFTLRETQTEGGQNG